MIPKSTEYKAGDEVMAKFRTEGWFPGNIVRLINREHDTPLYVVDIGRYECIIVTNYEMHPRGREGGEKRW